MKFRKKIPMRKCVISNQILPKRELIRIVKNKEGQVFVDLSGRANGHGAYIQPNVALIDKAKVNKSLEKALATKLTDEIYQTIISTIENYWD
ncbi:MAG: YlxR family protein [Spiroplasma sp.]|nr:YlxR family protein [Spiroplasma sp.]